eukprot:TRINITY_DN9682_c0_g3_i1.p1 TRINITY_DN9682_c0_g3~~TRINITY_DN9682_c0_g3_i1.p1  ORF type:complete len:267 (-),score=47.46 TRINITY_DN9682_c0_g3_i1:1-801(-)
MILPVLMADPPAYDPMGIDGVIQENRWISPNEKPEDKAKREAEKKKQAEIDEKKWKFQIKKAQVLSDQIYKHLISRIHIKSGKEAYVSEGGSNWRGFYVFYSDRRCESIVLDALLRLPKTTQTEALIPKLVAGLMAARNNAGAWKNTQENVWAVIAMHTYFTTYEKKEPDFVAKLWLGNMSAGSYKFKGRSVEETLVPIPMKSLLTIKDTPTSEKTTSKPPEKKQKTKKKEASKDDEGEITDFLLTKEGDGRLYYRLGLKYSPKDF